MSGLLDLGAIRNAHPLPVVAGAVVKLKRAGNEWKACCPFHADKSPSFTIYAGGERFQCFGCGAQGDVLDFIQRHHRVGLVEAAKMLGGGDLPVVALPKLGTDQPDSRSDEARGIWQSAGSVGGTQAEAYLRRRGITIALPDCLRFARISLGRRDPMPALIALVCGPDDRPSGVQRIYLTEDGRKADLPGGKVKFSLGRVKGGAVRLTPGGVSGMILSGSVEDGLSLVELTGQSVWAAPGETMLASMVLPTAIRSVTIGADADEAGRAAAKKAADTIVTTGREARIIYPLAPAKDFNEELMESRP